MFFELVYIAIGIGISLTTALINDIYEEYNENDEYTYEKVYEDKTYFTGENLWDDL